ncbi:MULTISPECIES: hypothetical protein [unclassified Curtobacterium]|uniref:hypothetical protein n=1 Tax=unclassified Curtobacterium TaxID=257496 RepID=UPI000DA9AAFB|nr:MULTISPECIES: hypothetical protein [unclassified Curtobacterium]PZE70906.1 hypothetical protein DEJ12_03915 [Curtobacterium sp. MCLR17_059]PZF27174.1 hypothetical protein DEJ05_07810 [Curtobacterium sp. MCLR17_045]PZF55227.1 hypothetical protein DEJ10_03100 [Curtobacterium sp. MCLR17_057]WIB41456.1 hypothetical protein DEJ11_11400 [Curtobacterium sp. MCLR17_058]
MPLARTMDRLGLTRRPRPTLHLVPDPHASDLVVVHLDADDAACGTCGHAQAAHEHYRPGTDCALCDCPKFRRAR